MPNTPLYPFGFGLSYTQFAYSSIRLNKTQLIGDDDQLIAEINIENIGSYDGEEVVQLYITDPVSTVTRAVRELKNFQKIFLRSKQTTNVTFLVTINDLKFYNTNLEYIWEQGEFLVHIGSNSVDTQTVQIHWLKTPNT